MNTKPDEEMTRKELIEEYRKLDLPFRKNDTRRELISELRSHDIFQRNWYVIANAKSALESQSEYIERLRKFGIIK